MPYGSFAHAAQVPVSVFGANTGLGSGDPRWRRKIDRTTKSAVDRNSDCHFWKDTNQSSEAAR